MKIWINKLLATFGYKIVKTPAHYSVKAGMDKDFEEIYRACQEFTMTSESKMYALFLGVKHILHAEITGDFVECGVWRGGSAILAALTMQLKGQTDRAIYLYDTYTGMTEPTDKDKSLATGEMLGTVWQKRKRDTHVDWAYAPLEEVKRNMAVTSYPEDKLIYVKGKVEDTIPGTMPERIALLRLDTDWYDSSYHTFVHLFPRLSVGGVLIIDDYGFWQGQRDATDAYFAKHNVHILLTDIGGGGAIGVKISE